MAEYTSLTDTIIKNLLAHYDLGRLTNTSKMQGGQANSSFKLVTDKDTFIVSICDEKNTGQIDALTKVLAYLNQNGFPTSQPVATQAGDFFFVHDHKPVYVKKFVPGHVIERLSSLMISQVGRTMARLHAIPPLENLPDQFSYGIESFDTLLDSDFQHPYTDWLRQKKNFLGHSIEPQMARGFIHGDMFWDNLLFANERLVAILDFEEACFYYKLYDLGMAAVGCCSRDGRFDMQKLAVFLDGYQQHCRLAKTEQSQLKVFMEYAAVAGSFWRFRQYHIRYPSAAMSETYKELAALADQVHAMDEADFMEIFKPLKG